VCQRACRWSWRVPPTVSGAHLREQADAIDAEYGKRRAIALSFAEKRWVVLATRAREAPQTIFTRRIPFAYGALQVTLPVASNR
jgi:hypothetical protein